MYCNVSTITGARGGPTNFKKIHRDPDPTNLTGKLTKLLTWSYIETLLHVLTTTPKGWMSLYPSHAQKRRNVFYFYMIYLQLNG